MFLNAGKLNKRISIYRREECLDEDGYGSPQEELVHSCWAQFTQTSGKELVRANSDFGEVNVRFLIRYPKKHIGRKMFVRYNGADYEIVYVNGYGDSGEYLEIWGKWLSREDSP